MKKVILFLSIISVTLLMTSCLGDSETYYSGAPLSYITRTELGTIYARPIDGPPMTSPQIRNEDLMNRFVYIAYSWKEGVNDITNENIYNATVTQISDPIDQVYNLVGGAAPELETELPLKSFEVDLYGGPYFDYHWICGYSYGKGDGHKKTLQGYYTFEEGKENEVIVDLRLVEAPTGGTIDKDQTSLPVAINFKAINDHYATGLSSGSTKTVQVYFRYWREKSDGTLELNKTNSYSLLIIKE